MTGTPSGSPERGNQPGYLEPPQRGNQIARNWLGKLGIVDGDWYIGSKHQLRRGMKARCLSPAGRIWCCLRLHAEGFEQELCVKWIAGKRVPLTPTDVAAETGVAKQHIRRCMLQLRAWGLGDIQGGQHHSVRLYCWAQPRQVDAAAAIETDPWTAVPKDLRSWFRRFRVMPDADFAFENEYLFEVHDAVTGYLKSVEVIKSVLRRADSRHTIQKNGEELEKNTSPQAASSLDTEGEPTPAPRSSSKAKSKTKRPRHRNNDAAELAGIICCDFDAADLILTNARKAGELTAQEVGQLCISKAHQVRDAKIGNLVGLWIKSIESSAVTYVAQREEQRRLNEQCLAEQAKQESGAPGA